MIATAIIADVPFFFFFFFLVGLASIDTNLVSLLFLLFDAAV